MIPVLVTVITATLLSLTDGHPDLVSLEECSPLSIPNFNFDFSEDQQSIYFNVGEEIDLNDYQVQTTVLMKRDGKYEKIISFTKTLCSQMAHILGAEWEKIREEIQPPIEDVCKIKPDTYKLEPLNMGNIEMSAILNLLPKGEIKLDIETRWKQDLVACFMVELENN